MRDYVDRRVTPPKQVTSPTGVPPPPCKQALSCPSSVISSERAYVSTALLEYHVTIMNAITVRCKSLKPQLQNFINDASPAEICVRGPRIEISTCDCVHVLGLFWTTISLNNYRQLL